MWAHLARAQNGSTALIRAAMKGHADCARLLLDAGADTEANDEVRASAGVGVRVLWYGAAVMVDWLVRRPAICIGATLLHFALEI